MAISGDYATPVYVNGFSCRNCTDVDNAKKNIDPAHPKSGPFNSTAETDPGARIEPQKVSAAVAVQSLRLLDIRV
jgi:hypothetical protein